MSGRSVNASFNIFKRYSLKNALNWIETWSKQPFLIRRHGRTDKAIILCNWYRWTCLFMRLTLISSVKKTVAKWTNENRFRKLFRLVTWAHGLILGPCYFQLSSGAIIPSPAGRRWRIADGLQIWCSNVTFSSKFYALFITIRNNSFTHMYYYVIRIYVYSLMF